MFKRVSGILLMIGGLALTVLTAVAMAYDIPRNFTVSGTGLDALVELIDKYDLKNHVLLICLGLTVALSSLALVLSPRRVRVPAPVVAIPNTAEGTGELTTANTADTAATADATISESAPKPTPSMVGTFYTHLMGTGLTNPGGRDRQRILSELKAGDVAVCRTVVIVQAIQPTPQHMIFLIRTTPLYSRTTMAMY